MDADRSRGWLVRLVDRSAGLDTRCGVVTIGRSSRGTEAQVGPKLQTRAFERVAPILQSGEEPVMAALASVGKFSSGRLGAIVSQSMAIQGGLVGGALASTTRQFVVL